MILFSLLMGTISFVIKGLSSVNSLLELSSGTMDLPIKLLIMTI